MPMWIWISAWAAESALRSVPQAWLRFGRWQHETTEEMVTTIKVIESTDSFLELDFNGEIRRFEKEN